MARFVNENFLPARVHVKEDPQEFKEYSERYKAPWTPTILMLDPDGAEHYRIEGFLPTDDFLAQLMLGRARVAFEMKQWADAERRFREVVERFANSDAAPEALYWAGVTRYKANGDAAALKDTARAFSKQFQDSAWAKKASIWR